MTSCSNTSRRQITPYVRRLVAATRWGDTSQRQIASCVLENFHENLCLRNRILSLQQVAKNQIFATCCGNKILLQRQRFSQKFSSTHEAICCCNVSPRHVAGTCRLVCTDLYIYLLSLRFSITSFLCNNASLQRVDENCVEALGPVTQILMSNVTSNIWISAHWSPDIGFCNRSLSESFVRKLNIFFLVHAVDLNLIHAAHRL